MTWPSSRAGARCGQPDQRSVEPAPDGSARAEVPLDSATLRHGRGREEQDGTLHLTDRRLVWRPRAAGDPGFELPLEDIEVVGRHQGREEAGVFVVGVVIAGELETLAFLPGRPKAPAVAEAERVSRRIREARNSRLTAIRDLEDLLAESSANAASRRKG